MNYLAGFMFLVIMDEAETYKAFDILINKYFKDMFENEFERIKLMYYTLDRLFSIFLPELAEHFK
jgi:hypothetical protein